VGPRLTLVMLDLEGLKRVNDTRGHQAGDEQLWGLAEVLRTLAAPNGKAYRLGGDEFGVLLPDATAWEGAELALTAAARLEDADISFRAGVASTTGEVPQAELTRRADLALVHAKRTNRTVELFADDLAARSELDARDGEATYRGTLAAALAQAVDAKDSYTRSHCETVATMCWWWPRSSASRRSGSRSCASRASCTTSARSGFRTPSSRSRARWRSRSSA
jgi:diguanylate cyclase (GGDEF)-like protein